MYLNKNNKYIIFLFFIKMRLPIKKDRINDFIRSFLLKLFNYLASAVGIGKLSAPAFCDK